MEHYNLFDEPWLYVLDENKKPQIISLRTFTENPDGFLELNFPVPGYNLAVLRYLISLLYCWNQPEDEEDWMELFQGNPFEPVQDFEARFRKYTDLFDAERPFQQNVKIRKTATKSVNALLNQLPAETGVRFFRHKVDEIHLGLPILPATLLSAHLFIPKQAGAGYYKGINAIPLFIFIKGQNLKETIIMNLISEEFLSGTPIRQDFMGEIDGDSDLLAFEEGEVSPADISIVSGMNWRSRNIFIHPEQGKTTCALTGERVEHYVENVDYKPGPKCADYWWDTMVSKITKQEKNGEILRYNVDADVFLPVWKGYVSLLLGHKQDNIFRDKPLVLQHYDILSRRYSNLPAFASVEAFGFTFKSGGKAFSGMVEEQLIYPVILTKHDDLKDSIHQLIDITTNCAYALDQALNILKRDQKNSRGAIFDDGEKYQFWHGLAESFNHFLLRISNGYGDDPSENEKLKSQIVSEWKGNLNTYTWKYFSQLASQVPYTAEGFKKLAKAKRALAKRLGSILKNKNEKEVAHATN